MTAPPPMRGHSGYTCVWFLEDNPDGPWLTFHITRVRRDGQPWRYARDYHFSFVARHVVEFGTVADATHPQSIASYRGLTDPRGRLVRWYCAWLRYLPRGAVAVLRDTYPIARDWLLDGLGRA